MTGLRDYNGGILYSHVPCDCESITKAKQEAMPDPGIVQILYFLKLTDLKA